VKHVDPKPRADACIKASASDSTDNLKVNEFHRMDCNGPKGIAETEAKERHYAMLFGLQAPEFIDIADEFLVPAKTLAATK
jgi:hypothetical protein